MACGVSLTAETTHISLRSERDSLPKLVGTDDGLLEKIRLRGSQILFGIGDIRKIGWRGGELVLYPLVKAFLLDLRDTC